MNQPAPERPSRSTGNAAKTASDNGMIACPQCGHDLPNRCMARCRHCGYYEPCGSEPPLGWLSVREGA